MARIPVVLVYFVLLASVGWVPGCGQLGLSEDERFQRAQDYEQAGDLLSAGIELRNLLQQNPEHSHGRLALGLVSLELGDLATARTELERARVLGLDATALHIPMARLWIAEGDYAQVIDTLVPEILFPDSAEKRAEGLVLRGEALATLGLSDQAMSAFEQALALRSNLPLAHVGIASVQNALGEVQDARRTLSNAFDLDPNSYQAWHLLGDIERSLGRLREAEFAYGQAAEHSRLPYIFHLKRALTRLALQDVDGMEQDLEVMHRLGMNHPATHHLQGLIYFQRGQYADAQTSFQESLSRNPGFQPAVFFLGATHLAQQQWRMAELQLQDYLLAHPESDEAARLLAQAQLGQGQFTQAEALLLSVLGRSPDDVLALNLIGSVYLSRGAHHEAIGHLRRAAELKPSDPSTRASLAMGLIEAGEGSAGLTELRAALDQADASLEMEATYVRALIRDGQHNEALGAADHLIERWPSSPLPYNLRAGASLALGDPEGAREALENALRVEPGNAAASENLGQLLALAGDSNAAKRIYRDALKYNPGHPDISQRLAVLLLESDGFDAARAVLEEAIRLHPEERAPRLTLARLHLERDEPQRALGVLEPIRRTATDDVQTLALLANAQIAAGQRAQAVGSLRELSSRVQETAANRLLLGAAFEQADSARDARAQYRRALELEPGLAEGLEQLARLEMREGRTAEALNYARRLQGDASAAAAGFAIEGQLHAAAGRREDAARALAEAYQRAPSGEQAVALARVYRQLERVEEAAALLEARLKAHPDEDGVRFHLAETLMDLGEHRDAIQHYEDLVRVFPEHLLVLNNLAFLYQTKGDDRALEYAERAHARAPDNPAVADTLGWVLVNRGEIERALPLLKTARQALPDRPEVRYHFATALAKADRPTEAREELVTLLNEVESFPQRADAEALLETLR